MTLLIIFLCFLWSGILIYGHMAFERLDHEDQRDSDAHKRADSWV